MNDDDLDLIIRRSQPKKDVPASFGRDVWTRIAVAEQRSWTTQCRRGVESLLLWVARPAPAFAVATMTLLFGAGLGNLTAPGATSAALRQAYVSSINPGAAHKGMEK